MSTIPTELKFTQSHEWVRIEGDCAVIGISDHAQQELTDVVFVELPTAGTELKLGGACAVVESVKTASDLYAPVSGKVLEINEALAGNPGLVNEEPYQGGWFFKVKLNQPAELDNLLTADAYRTQIGE